MHQAPCGSGATFTTTPARRRAQFCFPWPLPPSPFSLSAAPADTPQWTTVNGQRSGDPERRLATIRIMLHITSHAWCPWPFGPLTRRGRAPGHRARGQRNAPMPPCAVGVALHTYVLHQRWRAFTSHARLARDRQRERERERERETAQSPPTTLMQAFLPLPLPSTARRSRRHCLLPRASPVSRRLE